ncbi:MAG: hypothetical protein HeimC2_29100 [Candidatus Heimdallarchaeota archaeon LC_2]|nr:MAG: hypothetical protein HeimC2_29100 [Candidatus Heimdallarchaeota archaeon LC_2]
MNCSVKNRQLHNFPTEIKGRITLPPLVSTVEYIIFQISSFAILNKLAKIHNHIMINLIIES